jgi:hypothetical protein
VANTVDELEKVRSERHHRFERHARDIEGDLNAAAVPEEERHYLSSAKWTGPNTAAQTGVFDLDIRISNRPFIDVCKSFAAETGLKS